MTGGELAPVLITGVLGLSGIVIASIITRPRKNEPLHKSDISSQCLQHASIVSSLDNLEKLLTEVRTDVKQILSDGGTK